MKLVKWNGKRKNYVYPKTFGYDKVKERLDSLGYVLRFNDDIIPENSIKGIFTLLFDSNRPRQTYFVQLDGEGIGRQRLGYSRSIEDIYLLCKFYIPDVELCDVYKEVCRSLSYRGFCYSWKRHMFAVIINDAREFQRNKHELDNSFSK